MVRMRVSCPGSPASRVSGQREPVRVVFTDEDQLYGALLVGRRESAVVHGQVDVQPVPGNDLPREGAAQQREPVAEAIGRLFISGRLPTY